MRYFTGNVGAAAIVAMAMAAAPAVAADIVTDWASVKMPAPPTLKPVTVDPKTTALLLLDFMKGNCGQRPRCAASVPAVKKLLEAARANNMAVAFNLTGQAPKIEDMVDPGLAPRPGEHMIANGRGANKFYGSSLEGWLREKGIKTVIVTGTSAQGAVSGTSQGATERGMKAIVPVDGMSSEDAFREAYAAFNLAGGGPTALIENVTVTRGDMITYGK